jgi:hypothetical protein
MSMYYSHLLVPTESDVAFDGVSMAAFLDAAAKAGFVGRNPERHVRFPAKPRGQFVWTMSRGMPKSGKDRGPFAASWVSAESDSELLAALDKPGNVSATIWSEHRPRRPPLLALEGVQTRGHRAIAVSMDDKSFDDSYYVAITCWRLDVPVSMSDDGHYDTPRPVVDVPLGDPIDRAKAPPFAVANFTYKPGAIKVPGIATARSWVSLTFGDYVLPPRRLFEKRRSADNGLEFADPELVALAERALGCPLRQTCAWG